MDWGLVYRRAEGFLFQKMGEQAFLIPCHDGVASLTDVHVLDNEVALRVWELFDGKNSLGDVRSAVLEEFDAPPEVVEEDLARFVAELARIGVVAA